MDDEAKEILSRSLVHQIERLRAELAVQADVHTQIQMQLSDERDALRELLREALAHLRTGQWTVPTDITLMARIDAALNKGGGDE